MTLYQNAIYIKSILLVPDLAKFLSESDSVPFHTTWL